MRWLSLTALFLAAACGMLAQPAAATAIIFGPRGPEAGAATDWNKLFKPGAEWDAVARRFQTYSLTAGYVLQTPDNVLRAVAANLAAHHIGLDLAAQSVAVAEADGCGHGEGYAQARESVQVAQKLQRLGIVLDSVTLDEPAWFGHYDTGPAACRFTLAEVARRVAVVIKAYQQVFPGLRLGDIEPMPPLSRQPEWRAGYRAFLQAMRRETGQPIGSLQLDINWQTPEIDRLIEDVAAFAHGEGLRFGVIYNGSGDDPTDQAWVADAIGHFEQLESPGGLIPDLAAFVGWNDRPRSILPETSPGAFSHSLDVYQRHRTVLAAQRTGASLSGRLLDAAGAPVGGADILVQVIGTDANAPPPPRQVTGTVPEAARFAMLGMRVNTECLCGGENDLLMGDITYAESGAGSAAASYSVARREIERRGAPWDGVRVWPVAVGGRLLARAVVHDDQSFGFNSDPFSVTPGARYALTQPLGAITHEGMFGATVLIWLDAQKRGLFRSEIHLPLDATDITHLTTDPSGRFQADLPARIASPPRLLRLVAADTLTTRGCTITLR